MTGKERTPYVIVKCRNNSVTANGNKYRTTSSMKPKFEDIITNEIVMATGGLKHVQ